MQPLRISYNIAVVHVVTCNPALPDIIVAALKTSAVAHSPNGPRFIEKILRDPIAKETCVIIDLATVPDGDRLISFIQSSPSIRRLPIVALGTRSNFDSLSPGIEPSLNGVVTAPYTAAELASAIATACEEEKPAKPKPSGFKRRTPGQD